ncbi:MAG TPA: hypothetical protein VMV33_17375 [Rhodocyclaceae bacterium]|nr:hypothetical protein [Rhodocyclaceae bacterium]
MKAPVVVLWQPRRRCTHPALAIPCDRCGAYQCAPCTQYYSAGDLLPEPHQQRAETAEELGFRWAPGCEPAPAEPTPAEPEIEPPDPRQQSLF